MRAPAARYLLVLVLALGAGPRVMAQDNDFARLVEWLGGRWDNRQQAQDDVAGGVSGFDRHARRALSYAPVDAPAIAGRLFAVQAYDQQGFSGPLRRVTLARIVPSLVTTEFVHESLILADPTAWGDLRSNLATLRELRESDVRVNRGCRVYWRRVDDHFEGHTRAGRCAGAGAGGSEVVVEHFYALYADRLIRHERHYDAGGALVPREGGRTPEVFERL